MTTVSIRKPRDLITIHVLLLVAMTALSVMGYRSLPERYPIHFTLQGQPDRWSEKGSGEFWLVPAIGILLGLGFLFLLRFPQHFNYPQKEQVNRWPLSRRVPIYEKLLEFLLVIAILTDGIFLAIIWGIVDGVDGVPQFPVFTGIIGASAAMIGGTIYYLITISRLVQRISHNRIP